MTLVTIQDPRFPIDGQPTYAGRTSVEGLLFNLRTVDAPFEGALGRAEQGQTYDQILTHYYKGIRLVKWGY